jgi:outer membrane immunogenic protein
MAMRRIFLATLAVGVLAVGSAHADGLKDRPAYKPACAQFGGLYAGANGGWAFHDSTWVDRNAWVDNFGTDWALGSVGSTRDGFTGGVQAGYNWQRGCTVFGIEADANWAGLDSTRVYDPNNTPGAGTRLTLNHDVQWFGTLRTRSGLVVDHLLLYVTGGLAYANIKNRFTVTDPGDPTETFSASNSRWGWVGGVGAEWALSNSVSIRSEALYIKFSDIDTAGFSPAGPGPVVFDHQDSMWVGRVGINFRFGCGSVC